MTENTIELRILHGLPASGKSTFAKNFKKEFDKENNIYKKDKYCFIVDVDKIFLENKEDLKENFLKTIRVTVNFTIPDVLIIDGLFLTNKDIAKAISLVMEEYLDDLYQKYKFKIRIESWDEDRNLCIKNDILRNRKHKATTTIKNAVYEKVTKEQIEGNLKDILGNKYESYISKINSININKHSVYMPSNMELYFAESNIFPDNEENKIYSSSWCGGGSYGNCWDDTMSPVSAEDPPKYFEELADVIDSLKTVKPISIRDYFKIMDECVKIDEKFEADYYGGGTTYYRYVLNLNDLYDFLEKNNFL